MKKLKVFGIPWHVGHQYELAKMSFIEQYDLLINPYRGWGTTHRPFPDKCKWVTHYEKGKYDLAILHVDQQSIYNPEMGDRITKGKIYLEVRSIIGDDVPIVTINHMTPFHDKYESPFVVDVIRKMTEGTIVVVNSKEAAKQWGFGRTITHGLDKDEWWDLPKEPRAITVLSPEGMEKAYRRTFLTTVRRMLNDMGVPFIWVGVDRKFKSFDEYRDFIGRSLVFFMPTWQSPMPRARTEAMMSGCAIVSTPYQDADSFLKDGENAYLTSRFTMKNPNIMDNPEYTASIIKELVMDKPDEAIRIGSKAKQTAHELFTIERFEEQWVQMLQEHNIL